MELTTLSALLGNIFRDRSRFLSPERRRARNAFVLQMNSWRSDQTGIYVISHKGHDNPIGWRPSCVKGRTRTSACWLRLRSQRLSFWVLWHKFQFGLRLVFSA